MYPLLGMVLLALLATLIAIIVVAGFIGVLVLLFTPEGRRRRKEWKQRRRPPPPSPLDVELGPIDRPLAAKLIAMKAYVAGRILANASEEDARRSRELAEAVWAGLSEADPADSVMRRQVFFALFLVVSHRGFDRFGLAKRRDLVGWHDEPDTACLARRPRDQAA